MGGLWAWGASSASPRAHAWQLSMAQRTQTPWALGPPNQGSDAVLAQMEQLPGSSGVQVVLQGVCVSGWGYHEYRIKYYIIYVK